MNKTQLSLIVVVNYNLFVVYMTLQTLKCDPKKF